MSARTAARFLAVQALYQLDLVPGDPSEAFTGVAEMHEAQASARSFGEALATGAWARRDELDPLIAEHLADSWTLARVGRVEEVTIEGPSKKDPSVLTGRTRRNTLVHFASPNPLKVGSYATVRVTDARVNHLLGELVEVTIPARHRTRIPVSAG